MDLFVCVMEFFEKNAKSTLKEFTDYLLALPGTPPQWNDKEQKVIPGILKNRLDFAQVVNLNSGEDNAYKITSDGLYGITDMGQKKLEQCRAQ